MGNNGTRGGVETANTTQGAKRRVLYWRQDSTPSAVIARTALLPVL